MISNKGSAGIASIVIALGFVWLQLPALGLLPGDEWIYLKGGQLLADGVLPYNDYFLAHPPLRILLACLVWLLTGSMLPAKALSLAATLGTAGLLHLLAARYSRPWAGPLAVAFFLLSETVLSTAGFFIGVNITVFFVTAGFACLEFRRPVCAGLLHSLGLFCALYAALPVAVGAVLVLLFARPLARRYALGLLGVPLLFGLAWLVSGSAFVEQVFLYHLRKGGDMPGFATSQAVFALFVERNYLLLLLPLLAAPLWRQAPRLALACGAGLFLTAIIAFYPSGHSYYYLLALPFLALGAAGAVVEFARLLHGRSGRYLVLAVVSLLVLSSAYFLWETTSRQAKIGAIWRQVSMESAQLATDTASNNSQLVLFGDSSVVPMVSAILAPGVTCNVAGNILDTNPKRFFTDLTTPAQMLDRALIAGANRLLFIDKHGIYTVPEVKQWAQNHFELTTRFHARASACVYLVYEKRMRPLTSTGLSSGLTSVNR